MSSTNQIIIDGYMKAWGWFMRIDRGCTGYTTVKWNDLIGSTPVQIEDPLLERICAAMRVVRESRPATYSALYVLYVEGVDIKSAGPRLGLSRRRVADLRQDGFSFLSGMLFGMEIAEPTGRIQRWGEYPKESVV